MKEEVADSLPGLPSHLLTLLGRSARAGGSLTPAEGENIVRQGGNVCLHMQLDKRSVRSKEEEFAR